MNIVECGTQSSYNGAFGVDTPGGASYRNQVPDNAACNGTATGTPSVGDNRNNQSIYKSHEYEELPNSRFANPDYGYASADDNKMQLPPRLMNNSVTNVNALQVQNNAAFPNMMRVSHETSVSDQVTLIDGSPSPYPPSCRKRINPLYCTLKSTNVIAPPGNTRNQSVTLSLIALGLAVIACAVAATSVFLIFRTNADANSSLARDFFLRIDSLEQRHNMLIKALNDSFVDDKETNVTGGMYSRLVNLLHSEYSIKLNVLRDDVYNKLSNISKMHGPQGPPGVGNLTMCKYNSSSAGSPSQLDVTQTSYIPESVDVTKSWRITGITCSTDGGLYSFLRYQSLPGTQVFQFRCECSGRLPNANSRFCSIHYWSCPILS